MKIQRVLPLAISVAAMVPVCLAQAPVSFSSVTSISGETPANIYPVDVNNDGLTDVVQDTGSNSPSGFTVSINQGNGQFKAPVTYTLPGTGTIPNCIAAHDFNNDGKADLAVPLDGTNKIAVYLGKGDGTFQAPLVSTVNLVSSYVFGQFGCAAADFNGDGNIDLVTWTANAGWDTPSGLTELYVIQGNGNGTFSASPHAVLASGPAQPEQQVFVGDYDRDSKADIATEIQVEDYSTGDTSSTTMHVLYGNNDFTFDDTTPYIYKGLMTIGSGDLNSDGYTDLFALVGGVTRATQLGVFYGGSRVFANYWIDLSNSNFVGAGPDGWWWQSQLATADYNGDGRMDLAAYATSPDYTQGEVNFFLAGSSPGVFTSQVVALPAAYKVQTTPVAGLFSGSFLNPDLALSQSNNYGDPPQNTPSYLTAMLNQDHNWFGPCIYPRAGAGINVCSPGLEYQSNSIFSAAANSFGNLRFITLWVDGKKAQEQHHTWGQHAFFQWRGAFSPGTHRAVIVAGDVDHREQKYSFTFTVQ